MAFKQSVSRWPLSNLTDEQIKEIYNIGITGIEMPPVDEYDKWR